MPNNGILPVLLAFSAAMPAQGQRPGATPAFTTTVIPSVFQSPPNPHMYVQALDVNSKGEALIVDCPRYFDGAYCALYFWSAKTGLVSTGRGYMLGGCQPRLAVIPFRLNERGEIGGNNCGEVFLWSARTGATTLALLSNPWSIYDQVVALTDDGEIAGTTFFEPYYEAYYASARTGAVYPPFNTATVASVAIDMNNRGEMIGHAPSPFYWSLSTGVIPIDAGSSARVASIARDGTVLGVTDEASGGRSMFLWDRHHGVTAAAPLGEACSPYRATSSGLVVGNCGARVWTWTAKHGFTYYSLDAAFWFRAMNESGQVVGPCQVGDSQYHACLWSAETGLVDLDAGHPDRASGAVSIASDGTIGGNIGPDAAVWTPSQR
jgi:hypothetical protein